VSASGAGDLTVAAAAELIQARELSPLELTNACLERVEVVEPRLNAFVTVMRDEALAAAREAEAEISRGEIRSPLHGVPVALKDLFGVAGVRMTAGSRILSDNVSPVDSDAAVRLRAAGAIIVGKLNLHEFAFGATGINPHFGAARNPWDTNRITGGSSSGSAAAVAAGECLAALGTDTGGSIRIPASLCGVVGLKPTFGRVSRRGVLPLSWSLDHVGPLTRTVEDAAIVLGAIAGRDPLDASSIDEPVPDYRAALRGGVRGLRIGVPKQLFFDGLQPEVEKAVRDAVALLKGLGANVSEVSLPHIEEIPAALNAIQLPEAFAYHQKWMAERPQDYGDDVRYRLELGATFLAVHYIQAQRLRELAVQEWRDQVFDKVDVLATATTWAPAGRIDKAGGLDTTISLIKFTNPINFLSLPAVSLPCGFSVDGLPLALQLIARWFDEPTLLRAAHTYEQATDWHKRRPPL
jgi:aspartyl-tRNA(Asn)/glutamyl-tRNA(Gln) amidotransferase subunit A